MDGRNLIRSASFAGGISDVALECVMNYIDDPWDRDAISVVCKKWYQIDAITRKHITVALCYSATPGRLRQRFPRLESLKLKGKPRASMFNNIIPDDWGGYAGPWVSEIANTFLCLKSIHFRRMIVKDEDIRVLVRGRGHMLTTSKSSLLTDAETNSESLGFRGEALASLSDVSLVEIRTKARGMPNAYCKIIKGSNCLFLGIDDQREAVGTTVAVRDLFYNQPVRRKYMQLSLKRVLHSIKKCVLRIALVHPQVLFKVTDIASEEELLCTVPSLSPLSLVRDGFGEDVSSSLQEVVFSDQVLMLSGYISGVTNVFSTKAFQYLYINSRFVCKGPIHNLLNNLAATFQCSSTHRKVEPDFQSGKRQKILGYPAFLLNLCCSLSSYDLHFEPSKTVVEFKDWNTVLSFFEEAIKQFWKQVSEIALQGNINAHDDDVPIESVIEEEGLSKSCIMKDAECDVQLHQNIPSHSSVISPLDISLEDGFVYHKNGISSEEMHGFSWLKPCRKKGSYLGQAASSSQHRMHDSLDAFPSPHAQLGYVKSNQQWSADVGSSLLKNHLFSDQTTRLEDRYSMSDREWRENIPETSEYAGQWSADIGSSLLENNLFSDMTTGLEDRYGMSNRVRMKNIPENSEEDSGSLRRGASQILPDCDPFNIIDNEDKICPMPCFTSHREIGKERSYSLGYEKGHSVSFKNHSASGVGFDRLGKFSPFHDSNGVAEEDKVCSAWHTCFQEKDNTHRPTLSAVRKWQAIHDLDMSSNGATNPLSFEESSLYKKIKLHDGPASDFWVTDSKYASPEIDWNIGKPQSLSMKSLKTDAHGCNSREQFLSVTGAGCNFSGIAEEVEVLNSVQNSSDEVFPTRYTKTVLDFQCDFSPEKKVQYGSLSDQITFGKVGSSPLFTDETGWSPSESCNMTNTKNCSKNAFQTSMQIQDDGSGKFWDELDYQNSRPSKVHKVRSRRSCSAPPFYKGKHRFSTLNDHLTTMAGNDSTSHSPNVYNIAHEETVSCLNGILQSSSLSQPCLKADVNEVPQSLPRSCVDAKMSSHEIDGIQSSHNNAAEGSIAEELGYSLATPTKWRTGSPLPIDREVSHTNKDDVLSISSGLLHLSASSLVPESIAKDCLENARVLLQLDRKFIPVMAGEVLVIVDQHAADERIRLEELRHKVLSGEGNNITYLDSEQELVLPEMGYQLLQKYTDQIQKWGWICNIHTQCSESFARNVSLLRRRRCGVTLIAVPCILGIKLNGKDLVEFIEQLVETDGSSTIPPSVLRILNFKACRGAIMFGDSLLPSECSLILEELKATSLCFQCAHGRPTTVPLLNVASLREQLAILEMEKGGPGETWHGLHRHAPSIERARLRLESAERFHGG